MQDASLAPHTRPRLPAAWLPWALAAVALLLYLLLHWLRVSAYAGTGIAQALQTLLPSLIVLGLGGAALLALVIHAHRHTPQ